MATEDDQEESEKVKDLQKTINRLHKQLDKAKNNKDEFLFIQSVYKILYKGISPKKIVKEISKIEKIAKKSIIYNRR